jgi:hypothetical protein
METKREKSNPLLFECRQKSSVNPRSNQVRKLRDGNRKIRRSPAHTNADLVHQFTDLPPELMGIIAEMLVSEKAYASCAALNQTCHAAFDATSPILWHTIDFMFTIGGLHPDEVYVSGRRKDSCKANMEGNNRLRDYVRLMFNELWAKSAACQTYTKYAGRSSGPLLTVLERC